LIKGGLDLRDSINMPNLYEMDFAAIVKRWSDKGNQTGTTKKRKRMEPSMDNDAGEGDSASLLVKRNLEKNRNMFFVCNENESAQNQSETKRASRFTCFF
jgi:hypothetical protein